MTELLRRPNIRSRQKLDVFPELAPKTFIAFLSHFMNQFFFTTTHFVPSDLLYKMSGRGEKVAMKMWNNEVNFRIEFWVQIPGFGEGVY